MYFRYNATTKLFQIADTPTDPETAFTNMQLDAAQLTQGTVNLSRLSNIANAQISASAAIAWSKISKTGSSIADFATRSATDLNSGTLPDARLSSNVVMITGNQTIGGNKTFSGVTTLTGVPAFTSATLSGTATAGGAGLVSITGFMNVVINGTTRKIAYYTV